MCCRFLASHRQVCCRAMNCPPTDLPTERDAEMASAIEYSNEAIGRIHAIFVMGGEAANGFTRPVQLRVFDI